MRLTSVRRMIISGKTSTPSSTQISDPKKASKPLSSATVRISSYTPLGSYPEGSLAIAQDPKIGNASKP